ncbi:hypothetical protein AB3M83_11005 [Microbacterium sp. 179-B 1A2 NHS]|uniref:hypothetical protein n=1 Tax=Microbacterium sp. 179-B 1A2 NHS TaxID=3142383 RepID=UPI0039A03731
MTDEHLIDRTLTRDDLRDRGFRRRDLDRAIASGRLLRLRPNRYVTAGVTGDQLTAIGLGARLDCVSLLRALGVFVLGDDRLHVQLEPHASHRGPTPAGVVRHWRPSGLEPATAATDVVSALAQATRCQDPRAAIATLDSAWHAGVVDEAGIAAVFARLPRRLRRLRKLLDPRAESGPETLMRLILRSLGCSWETQTVIRGVGRVDFVVEGWLIIECDSEAHHASWEQQKRDRRRDLAAAARGFTTVRPIAEDIFFHRDALRRDLAEILGSRHR